MSSDQYVRHIIESVNNIYLGLQPISAHTPVKLHEFWYATQSYFCVQTELRALNSEVQM
jgi:hypothetical protein